MFAPPPWQVWVGVAVLLLLAVAAVVTKEARQPGPAAPVASDLDAPAAVTERLEQVFAEMDLPASLELHPVVELTYKGTRHVRLRPYLQGVELRGADLRLEWVTGEHPGPAGQPPAASSRVVVDFEPWPESWKATETLAAAGATVHTLSAASWWNRIGLGRAQQRMRDTTVRPYIALQEGRAPRLLAEVGARFTDGASRDASSGASSSDLALTQAWSSLPWEGARPEPVGPLWLEVELDASGSPVSVRDGRLFDEPNGRALVFDPDPVTTSKDRSLRDGDPVEHWRTWVDLYDLDDSGYLRGPRVSVVTDRPPRARELDGVFEFVSADPRFEEAMAYAHGDRALRRVAELIGAARSRALTLRVHGTAADNSWFSRPQDEIIYGDGGVDDAEDADIILHEVGHAIHDLLVPGFGGGDSRALSEGFADFWAATRNGDPCVGDWDATSYSPPCLRECDLELAYPFDRTGRPHDDGRIYSGALWEIRTNLGAELAEPLALLAFLEQDTDATFPEAGASILAACDRMGLSESDRAVVLEALGRRGLARRILVAELDAARPQRSISLLGQATFLGRPVEGLVVHLDGRVGFADIGGVGDPNPFPEGFPSLIAAGPPPGTVLQDPDLGLRITLAFDPGHVEIDHLWTLAGVTALRTSIEWDPVSGQVSWTYRETGPAWSDARFEDFVTGLHDRATTTATLADFEPLDGFRESSTEVGFLAARDGQPWILDGARFFVERSGPSAGDNGGTEPTLRLFRTGQPLAASHPGRQLSLSTQPNPFVDRTEVRLRLRTPETVKIRILDAAGRNVLSTALPREAGVREWSWNGTDGEGRDLPSGRYWLRVDAGAATATAPILKLR